MLSQCTYIVFYLYFPSFLESGNTVLQVSIRPGNLLAKAIKQTTHISVHKTVL